MPASAVAHVVHGTTLVTNALIERKGARTALITTRGFRDAVEIGREHRYDMYDLFLELPTPLVPRHLRFEVDERMLADGSVLDAARPRRGARLIAALRAERIQAVAVCLLHSYRNPAHERAVGELLRAHAPEIGCALSCEVVPEIREYERTSTTLANVYVQGLAGRYLRAPRGAPARDRHRRRAVRHAVQRRHVRRRDRLPLSRAPDRIRARRPARSPPPTTAG